MPDYDDLLAMMNSLESSWPGYEKDGLPAQLEQQLNRCRANISDAANGDEDGLTGAVNNLKLLQQEAQNMGAMEFWIDDVSTVIRAVEDANVTVQGGQHRPNFLRDIG